MVKHCEQIEILAQSAWNACKSVREGVIRAGLPVPTGEYLRKAFSSTAWKKVDRAIAALREHFSDARFGNQATFGALLVPDPAKLYTRGALDPAIRLDQVGKKWRTLSTRNCPRANWW
jgi:hypothetical protein